MLSTYLYSAYLYSAYYFVCLFVFRLLCRPPIGLSPTISLASEATAREETDVAAEVAAAERKAAAADATEAKQQC
jgi:hypothetical protein